MSKAKELARKIKEFPKACYVYAIHDDLGDLIDAVLSEPEPELKGWIEVTVNSQDEKRLLRVADIIFVDDRNLLLNFNDELRSRGWYQVKESYDSIKQKIKEAG